MDLFNLSSAIFSPDRKHRYMLCRVWNPDKKMLAFIGLNPSTANEQSDDPTIRRVSRFTKDFGYGGFYMLNLFSFVTAHPEELSTCEDPIRDNDQYLVQYGGVSDRIIFVWGNFKVFGRDKRVQEMFPNAYCLGINSNGSPKHPLYLKSDTQMAPFCTAIHEASQTPEELRDVG